MSCGPTPCATPVGGTPAHVLVVDDHADIREPLAAYLRRCGLHVSTASDGPQMRARLDAAPADLIVLDIMLPGEDGLSLCRQLTRERPTPVILLTAMAATAERIHGLNAGADDYVVKPFDPGELLARIHSVLRRQTRAAQAPAPRAQLLGFDGWRFDLARRRLTDPQGQSVPLSGVEHQLLAVFATRPRQVLSREQLLDLTRGHGSGPLDVFDRSIDTQVSRLRRKIEADPRQPALLRTVRGGGYMFVADVRALP